MPMVRARSGDRFADDIQDSKVPSENSASPGGSPCPPRPLGVVGRSLIGLLACLTCGKSSLVGLQSVWREDFVALEIPRFLVKGIGDIRVRGEILK
jgi:hypothetical protein